jgi:glycerophosphoryl diester phosphodiesterase
MSSEFTIVAKAAGLGEGVENSAEACDALLGFTPPPGIALCVEIDVRVSRDAGLVALHDETLERATTGRGLVRDHTLEELRRLATGPRGERVATLDEIVEACGRLQLVVEPHAADPFTRGALLNWLQRASAEVRSRIIVASEQADLVWAVRRSPLEVRTAATSREALAKVLLERLCLEDFAARGHTWMVPERHRGLQVITARFVHSANAAGDAVWAYVIDDPDTAMRLHALGVDAVFTTVPRALALALGERLAFSNSKGVVPTQSTDPAHS